MPQVDLGEALLALARGAIGERFGRPAVITAHAALAEPGATFVTLTREGRLRGCIGSLEPHRPLGEDVRENALAAAFHDPRFVPLAAEEFEGIRLEVSLLGRPEPIVCEDEADCLARLRPGIDGIVFQYGRHRSTFLPQVWESLPEPAQFMQQLKRKAGLPADFWHEDVRISRYQVRKWREER